MPADREVSDVNIVDADGHVIEDSDEIASRLPLQYKESFLRMAGNRLFPPLDTFHWMPKRARGWDARAGANVAPAEWIRFLDEVGIAKTTLYPTAGLSIGRVHDLDYCIAVCRAYNDWLAETYLQHDSRRFGGVALIPMQVPSAAVDELQRAVDLGFSAVMIPAHGLPTHLGAIDFWPVYEAAAALDCGIAIHGGSHEGMGFDDFNVFAPVHALGHPVALLIALGGMLFNGVFDRNPRLRVAFLEGGAAWVLLALERFDESADAFASVCESKLRIDINVADVGDYLLALLRDGRIVVGCEGGESNLGLVNNVVECVPFMYSSDFPHEVDHISCGEEVSALRCSGLSVEVVNDILGGVACRFYGYDERPI